MRRRTHDISTGEAMEQMLLDTYDPDNELFSVVKGVVRQRHRHAWEVTGTNGEARVSAVVSSSKPIGVLGRLGVGEVEVNARVSKVMPPYEGYDVERESYMVSVKGGKLVSAFSTRTDPKHPKGMDSLTVSKWEVDRHEQLQQVLTGIITPLIRRDPQIMS